MTLASGDWFDSVMQLDSASAVGSINDLPSAYNEMALCDRRERGSLRTNLLEHKRAPAG